MVSPYSQYNRLPHIGQPATTTGSYRLELDVEELCELEPELLELEWLEWLLLTEL